MCNLSANAHKVTPDGLRMPFVLNPGEQHLKHDVECTHSKVCVHCNLCEKTVQNTRGLNVKTIGHESYAMPRRAGHDLRTREGLGEFCLGLRSGYINMKLIFSWSDR